MRERLLLLSLFVWEFERLLKCLLLLGLSWLFWLQGLLLSRYWFIGQGIGKVGDISKEISVKLEVEGLGEFAPDENCTGMVPGVDEPGLDAVADPTNQTAVLMALEVLGLTLFQHASNQVVPEMAGVIAQQVVLVQRPPVTQLHKTIVNAWLFTT